MANNADIKFNVDNLELFYGNFKALKGIDMEIKKNEITALIGPSGCGKSTFLKTLNRMNDLEDGVKVTGRIHLDGVDIYKEMDSITLRHRVGMVFQQPNPFPKSIYDNVAYGPRIHGIRKKSQLDEIVERSLRQAAIWDELKDRLNKSALGLSGGQQQRTSIGRAIIKNPDLLLCDEPTGALDYHTSKDILRLIETVNQKYGNTIVMVTHNDAIKDMADRVVKLRDGMIRKNYTNEQKVPAMELEW